MLEPGWNSQITGSAKWKYEKDKVWLLHGLAGHYNEKAFIPLFRLFDPKNEVNPICLNQFRYCGSSIAGLMHEYAVY